jgi:hypothetical protein
MNEIYSQFLISAVVKTRGNGMKMMKLELHEERLLVCRSTYALAPHFSHCNFIVMNTGDLNVIAKN